VQALAQEIDERLRNLPRGNTEKIREVYAYLAEPRSVLPPQVVREADNTLKTGLKDPGRRSIRPESSNKQERAATIGVLARDRRACYRNWHLLIEQ